MQLPPTRLSQRIDSLLTLVGRAANWLWLVLLFVIVSNVGLRYLFGEGRVEFEELQWHLNALAFLIAIAYAYRLDVHIRIDVASSRMTPRTQAWIELYGTLLLLLPFIAMVLIFALPFVAHSWAVSETSQSPGGLGFRWFLKAALPFAFGLLLLGVVARLSRLLKFLATSDR